VFQAIGVKTEEKSAKNRGNLPLKKHQNGSFFCMILTNDKFNPVFVFFYSNEAVSLFFFKSLESYGV
jgi:hypothetical protein